MFNAELNEVFQLNLKALKQMIYIAHNKKLSTNAIIFL